MKATRKDYRELDLVLIPVPHVLVFPNTAATFTLTDKVYIDMLDKAKEVHPKGLIGVSMSSAGDLDGSDPLKILRPNNNGVICVPTIDKHNEDGSKEVHLQGLCKMKITKIVQAVPYVIVKVKPMVDLNDSNDFIDDPKFSFLVDTLKQWTQKQINDPDIDVTLLPYFNNAETIMNYLSVFLIQDHETRQVLLETDSLKRRFEMLYFIFRELDEAKHGHLRTATILKDFFGTHKTDNVLSMH